MLDVNHMWTETLFWRPDSFDNSNNTRHGKFHNECLPQFYSKRAIEWIIQSAPIKIFN